MTGVVGRRQKSGQIYGLLARQGLSTNQEVEKFIPELAQKIPGVSPQIVCFHTTTSLANLSVRQLLCFQATGLSTVRFES